MDTLALPEPTYSQVLQNQSENPDLSNSSVSTSPTITPPQHFSESSRKFNVVIFGVPEQPKGTSRFTREQNDFKEAASAIANTESESNHTSSIRECRRLGKYNVSKTRPILVTLNSTADVSYILSHCHHLHSPISIKPDLSLQDRKAKAILLHERWKLIQSGIERKSIKLRNLSLFVNNRPYGKIINGVFSLIHARDKVATPSSNSSNTSQQVPSKVTGSTPSLPLPTSLHTSETSSTSSQPK